jgi:glycine cleavage system H protein
MSKHQFPADRRYTSDHEWALSDQGEVLVGVSAFAVEQLGDITLVSVDVKVGDKIEKGKGFGTIESVKTLSDLFCPISGTVTRINEELADKPELVNEDCYKQAWMIAIKPTNSAEYEGLLDQAAYSKVVEAADH